MSNILEAIHSLEDKLQTLLSNYEFLKKENEILLQSTTNFQHKILEQQQFIVDQKRAFDVLKVAKVTWKFGVSCIFFAFKLTCSMVNI